MKRFAGSVFWRGYGWTMPAQLMVALILGSVSVHDHTPASQLALSS